MTCLGCRGQVELTEREVAELIAEQLALETDLVPTVIADQRRRLCHDCAYFTAEVCQKCGCYAEFRLNLWQKNCPLQKW